MKNIKKYILNLLFSLSLLGIFIQPIFALTVTPTSGPVNLNVKLSFNVQDLDCTSYKINWGDGKIVEYEPETLKTENCETTATTLTFSKYYMMAGTYTISVLSGQGSLASLSGTPDTAQVTATVSTDLLDISPEVGPYPLNTTISFHINGDCTSYDLDFGDGSSHKSHAATISSNCPASSLKSFSHAYTQSGNYTVKLKVGDKPFTDLTTSDEKNVIVNKTRDSLETGTRNGKSPFTAQFTAILNGRGSCEAQEYVLDFGDGETENLSVAAGGSGESGYCGSKTVETSHIYTSGGSFTAKLKKGSQIIESHIFNIGAGDNCPVLPKPTCNYDQVLISTGLDRDDCDTGWQCVNKDDISHQCPAAKNPTCGSGKKHQSLGWKQGCYLGWTCVDDNSAQPHGNQTCNKPVQPDAMKCRRDGGMLIDKGRDAHGCWLGFMCYILPKDSNYNPPRNHYFFNRGRTNNNTSNNKIKVRKPTKSWYKYKGRGSVQDFLFSRKLRSNNTRNKTLQFKSNLSKSQLKLRRGASLRERLQFLRSKNKKRNTRTSTTYKNKSLLERLKRRINTNVKGTKTSNKGGRESFLKRLRKLIHSKK